jgi:transcription initiation factor TFIIF subunit beta
MARMPRNQLLDALFALFREREQWPIKLLREKTQQPEVYLKEVLSEIATLHRSGEFNGTWELMPSFKGDGVRLNRTMGCSKLTFCFSFFFFPAQIKAESMSQLYASQPSNADASMDDYDDDDDDDDDMEEVME